jgi:RNA polymerase sigma-70 factor (ECF subfamily)
MIGAMRLPLVMIDQMIAGTRELERTLPAMDEEEFRAFYERTARPLWAYLSRIAGSAHEAEDLLQEAYYRFYRAGAQHADDAHRRNSLFHIATNLVRDAARRAKHHTAVALESESEPASELQSKAPTPERQASLRTDLGRAMNQLDPIERELLTLAYAQGASHEEIADILGLRPISIRTLLLRARRRVADILGARTGTERRS